MDKKGYRHGSQREEFQADINYSIDDINTALQEIKKHINESVANNSLNQDYKRDKLLNMISILEKPLSALEDEVANLVDDDFIHWDEMENY